MSWKNVVARARFWLAFPALSLTLLSVFVPAAASACRVANQERITFLTDVSAETDAPTIVHVTVVTLLKDYIRTTFNRNDYTSSYIGLARVEKVIKGELTENEIIKIISPHDSCYNEFRVGSTGIVLGTASRNIDGMVELSMKGVPYARRPRSTAN